MLDALIGINLYQNGYFNTESEVKKESLIKVVSNLKSWYQNDI